MLNEIGRTLLERWIYVLVKVDADFVAPYTAPRRARILAQGGYGAGFAPFLERFLGALALPGRRPGGYFPGGWYRALMARQADPLQVPVTPEALDPFFLDEIVVDRQGRWFVGDKPITGRVLGHFLRNLHFDAELGRYLIRYRLEQHFDTRYLHHRSPPIRVRRVTVAGDLVTLWLNTGASEPLRPETLRMDAGEQLYCAVDRQGLPAWFEEPARWELLKDAAARGGTWVLRVNGRELAAPLDAPWPYADALPD